MQQSQLRNDNAAIMRRVARGESFTVTVNGMPVADLVPHHRFDLLIAATAARHGMTLLTTVGYSLGPPTRYLPMINRTSVEIYR